MSLVATACLAACTAGTNPSSTGSGTGTGGSNSAGVAGTSGGAGRGGNTGMGGSGIGGIIITGGSGGRTCGLQNFDVERKPAEILLLLDRSKSMIEDSTTDGTLKWNAVLPALKQVIMDTDAAVSWGLKTFPEGTGSACVAGSVTNNVVVPIAPMNAAAVVGALNDTANAATQPQGNGTPTGDAVTGAFNYLRSLTSTNPKYILLATDGAPSCAGTTEGGDAARTYAYEKVTAAASASPPIYTFVVGVATNSNSEQMTLNMLADAGGRPRPGLLQHFYLGNTTTELKAALAAITGQAATCTFPLNPPPPVMNDPTKLGVYFPTPGNAMTKVPYDDTMTNGWAFTDANDTAVQVYGAWCDMIKASGANTVQIIYGCPDIDVP